MFAIRLPVVAGLLVLCVALGSAPAQEITLTYLDLIGRMTDMSYLATLPEPGETCGQCSSYDRASRYDEATGKYVAWDANGDGGGIIRAEGDTVVMAEMQGPGCIWRIWSAAAGGGHVKIYLDGQETPAVDLPFTDYFQGKTAPFDYPGLSYDMTKSGSAGQNLYMPIPYQKSCKIVADKGWGNYYHFNYTTYPAGTKVPTFSTALVAENDKELRAISEYFLTRLGTDYQWEGEEIVTETVEAAPGQTVRVAAIEGPRAIVALWVKADFANREDEMAALRRMSLRITWDDQSKPAVWCPLGDFFGTAPGVNLYKTLPTGMTEDGFYSLWYMPFAENAVIELVNEDGVARRVTFRISHAPLGRPFEGLGHFHAKWHRDTAELPKDRWPDWVMLQTDGRGRFCGVMLHVWNPRGGWWGEGDEKFFVDGEKFPSTIGTGSEDYFGYAWGHAGLFQKPYHAQSMTQDNKGHQSVLRWHITDNVPFQKSFEASIEKYYTNDRGTLFACTVCWYLSPDGVDPYEAVPVEDRDGYYEKPDQAFAGIKVLNEPAGNLETQNLASHGENQWKNDEQLWWTGAKPGDNLVLAVPKAVAGKYEVVVHLTKAIDYGIVQLSFDEQKLGEPIDLFNDGVVSTGPISLGVFDLDDQPHTLTVEIVGANDKAVKAYMFGIDRIDLKPAE